MAKKKHNNNNNNNTTNNNNGSNNEDEKKEEEKKTGGGGRAAGGGGGGGDGGDKKEGKNAITVVLKVEMDCEGCASRIIKFARGFEGVETVKAELDANKLTVIGKVDPSQIQENLQNKTKKRVDLISPQPKKDDSNNNKNKNDDDKKQKGGDKKANEKKPDAEKKPKEIPVTTAVLKLAFHCQGCIEKIYKTVSKTKGVQDLSLDKQKETVTVKGTMDMKALTEVLQERLKRPVEIVPPKKEKEKEKEGGDKGGEKEGGGGGGGKKKNSGGGQNGGGDGAKMEENRMEYMIQPGFGLGYGLMGQPMQGNGYMGQQPLYGTGYMGQQPMYGNGYMVQPQPFYGNGYMAPQPVYGDYGYGYSQIPGYPAHMKFNDENPNACSMM